MCVCVSGGLFSDVVRGVISIRRSLKYQPFPEQMARARVHDNMEFCWLVGSVGGWVFALDVTRG